MHSASVRAREFTPARVKYPAGDSGIFDLAFL